MLYCSHLSDSSATLTFLRIIRLSGVALHSDKFANHTQAILFYVHHVPAA